MANGVDENTNDDNHDNLYGAAIVLQAL